MVKRVTVEVEDVFTTLLNVHVIILTMETTVKILKTVQDVVCKINLNFYNKRTKCNCYYS
jgi:hypothetical protein